MKKEERAEEEYSAREDLREPLGESFSRRLPWLILLFGLGLLVSGVAGLFEEIISHLSVIVSFQSLVLGMAGNVGTQSLAVTIRALSGEKMTARQMRRLVLRESGVGLCNGLVLGGLSFLLIGAYLHWLRGISMKISFSVSLCTGLALFFSMLLSGIAGSVIPLLCKRFHIDPAVASGPFITTVNDLVAVVAYYGLAWLILIRWRGI